MRSTPSTSPLLFLQRSHRKNPKPTRHISRKRPSPRPILSSTLHRRTHPPLYKSPFHTINHSRPNNRQIPTTGNSNPNLTTLNHPQQIYPSTTSHQTLSLQNSRLCHPSHHHETRSHLNRPTSRRHPVCLQLHQGKHTHTHTPFKTHLSLRALCFLSKVCLPISLIHTQASILGNYYHAAFNTASTDLITLADRAKAISDENILANLENFVEPALAEYVAATTPITTNIPTHSTHIPWHTFKKYAIALANYKIRGVGKAPPIHPLTQFPTPPIQQPSFTRKSYINILAPTGFRQAVVCEHCHLISTNLRPHIRGFKTLCVASSPFKQKTPRTTCIDCNNPCRTIQLHGIMLCLTPTLAIVVCPGCNHPHPITQTLKTTLCHACIRVPALWSPELARTCIRIAPSQPHPEHPDIIPLVQAPSRTRAEKCIAHQHPITNSPVLHQRMYDPIINKSFVLPVCEAHISHSIIVSSDYTPRHLLQ